MTNGYNTPIGVPIGLPSILSLGLPPLVNPYPTLNLDFINNPQFDSRITFSRGSQATLFDSTGTLVYAKHNLFLQSQNFTITWGNTRSTDVADTDTAPDGTVTADSVLQASGQTDAGFVGQSVSVAIGEYVYSVFAKPNGKNFLILQENALDGTQNLTWFDVQNGTVGTTDPGHTPTITASTNGYYRCSIRFTVNAARTGTFLLRLADTNGSTTVVDNGAGLYLWGAQLNLSNMEGGVTSSLTTYYPTTTAAYYAPRFDYNPSTLQPRGLLIEEARTNSVLRSQEFDDPYFTKVRTSITANAIVAPDGTLTADKLVENTDTNTHLMSSTNITAVIGTVYTYSIFAKAGERNLVAIGDGTGGSIGAAIFDLSAGTVTFFQAGGSATITAVGNGWYRCTYTTLAAVDTTINFTVYMTNSTTTVAPSYTGNGTSGFFIWGAQLEAGAFATSYIPTTTTALTRNQDVASIATLTPWFNASEGTLFGQVTSQGNSGTNDYFMSFNDTTSANLISLLITSAYARRFTVVDTSVGQASLSGTAPTPNVSYKHAGAYKVNDFAACIDGGTVLTDTVGTVPTVTILSLTASHATANGFNGWLQRIAYYPTRLPDATLQALTA